jgi:hypothetical protein
MANSLPINRTVHASRLLRPREIRCSVSDEPVQTTVDDG